MFRLALRPSPLGFALGLAVVAFWALLWVVFLFQLIGSRETAARQPGAIPEPARVEVSPWPGLRSTA